MRTNSKGEAATIVLVVLAVGALGAWLFKPKALHGDSKRAAASTEATAKLEAAQVAKDAVVTQRSAEAASSVVVMDGVVSSLPETPEKSFLKKEGQVVLSKLPAPDPLALLEAEKRKVAELTGRVEESRRLYGQALTHSQELASKLEAKTAEAEKAKAERQAIDLKLEQVAAERLGAERLANQLKFAVAIIVLVLLYVKFTHLSPGALAEAVRDGGQLSNIDSVTTRLQQGYVRLINKFHS